MVMVTGYRYLKQSSRWGYPVCRSRSHRARTGQSCVREGERAANSANSANSRSCCHTARHSDVTIGTRSDTNLTRKDLPPSTAPTTKCCLYRCYCCCLAHHEGCVGSRKLLLCFGLWPALGHECHQVSGLGEWCVHQANGSTNGHYGPHI
jgi:hypothetical protein